MGKILPILLALLGLGAGIGAGILLRPEASNELANACGDVPPPETKVLTSPVVLAHNYVRLNNQFVVPVVQGGRIKALVVMSLSVEVVAGNTEAVYEREPKLRDAFLRVMFDHANSGGFDGSFTSNGNMAHLRSGLVEAAKNVLGAAATDVLIIDIVRQDT